MPCGRWLNGGALSLSAAWPSATTNIASIRTYCTRPESESGTVWRQLDFLNLGTALAYYVQVAATALCPRPRFGLFGQGAPHPVAPPIRIDMPGFQIADMLGLTAGRGLMNRHFDQPTQAAFWARADEDGVAFRQHRTRGRG